MENKILNNEQFWLTKESEIGTVLKSMDFATSGDKNFTYIYYNFGSEEIDKLLGSNYTEKGYISTIIATQGTISIFFLDTYVYKINDQGTLNIGRDSILHFDEQQNISKTIINLSKSKDNFRFARNMSGLVGRGITNLIDRKNPFKMTDKVGVNFNLYYLDTDGEEQIMQIFAENEYASVLRVFLKTYYKKELPLEAQKPSSDSLCYIATACYGDLYSPEVILLRKFRDEHLKSTFLGKTFIKFYYSSSAFFYKPLLNAPILSKKIKNVLDVIVKFIRKKYYK